MYYGGNYLGMNLIWWFFWAMLIFWIFVTPYNIPGQRYKKESPFDILKRRLASGEITNVEYLEKLKMLEIDFSLSVKK